MYVRVPQSMCMYMYMYTHMYNVHKQCKHTCTLYMTEHQPAGEHYMQLTVTIQGPQIETELTAIM